MVRHLRRAGAGTAPAEPETVGRGRRRRRGALGVPSLAAGPARVARGLADGGGGGVGGALDREPVLLSKGAQRLAFESRPLRQKNPADMRGLSLPLRSDADAPAASAPHSAVAAPWRPALCIGRRNTPVDGKPGHVEFMSDRGVANVGTKDQALAAAQWDRSRDGRPALGEGVEACRRVNRFIGWCDPQPFRTLNVDERYPDGALRARVACPGVGVEGNRKIRAPRGMDADIGGGLRDELDVAKSRTTDVEGDGSEKALP